MNISAPKLPGKYRLGSGLENIVHSLWCTIRRHLEVSWWQQDSKVELEKQDPEVRLQFSFDAAIKLPPCNLKALIIPPYHPKKKKISKQQPKSVIISVTSERTWTSDLQGFIEGHYTELLYSATIALVFKTILRWRYEVLFGSALFSELVQILTLLSRQWPTWNNCEAFSKPTGLIYKYTLLTKLLFYGISCLGLVLKGSWTFHLILPKPTKLWWRKRRIFSTEDFLILITDAEVYIFG